MDNSNEETRLAFLELGDSMRGLYYDDVKKYPIHYAVKNNSVSEVEKLLSRGFDVNLRDSSEATPLHYVSWRSTSIDESYMKITEMLLKNRAEINARDSYGRTPLYFCVRKGSKKIVQLFLNYKADFKAVDNFGETLLLSAARGDESEKVLQLLIDLGLYVNRRNKLGDTALHSAYKVRSNILNTLNAY